MSLLLSQIKILAGTQSAPSAVREREVPSRKFHQKEKTLATTTIQLAENNLLKTRCVYYCTQRALHTRVLILIRLSSRRRYILLVKCISLRQCVQTLSKLCVLPGLLSLPPRAPKTPLGCVYATRTTEIHVCQLVSRAPVHMYIRVCTSCRQPVSCVMLCVCVSAFAARL